MTTKQVWHRALEQRDGPALQMCVCRCGHRVPKVPFGSPVLCLTPGSFCSRTLLTLAWSHCFAILAGGHLGVSLCSLCRCAVAELGLIGKGISIVGTVCVCVYWFPSKLYVCVCVHTCTRAHTHTHIYIYIFFFHFWPPCRIWSSQAMDSMLHIYFLCDLN